MRLSGSNVLASLRGATWLAIASCVAASACGDDDRAPVSPVPPVRDMGGRPPPPPMDDMGVPPMDDMGVPPVDDMGGPPTDDMGGPPPPPPPTDMGGPPPPPPTDMGPPPPPRDSGPRPDGGSTGLGPITRAILRHTCDTFSGNPTLLLELSGEPAGTCHPAPGAQLGFTVFMDLPVVAPESFTGSFFVTGVLCVPDGFGGLHCTTGANPMVTFDTYVDRVSATGSYIDVIAGEFYEGDFSATFCPDDLTPCGG